MERFEYGTHRLSVTEMSASAALDLGINAHFSVARGTGAKRVVYVFCGTCNSSEYSAMHGSSWRRRQDALRRFAKRYPEDCRDVINLRIVSEVIEK